MITIKSKKKSYAVTFPTNISEISAESLIEVLKPINLPKYHCVVAMCSSFKLFDVVTAINGVNKNQQTTITPLLAKINESDNENLQAKVGERVIIDRSSLERGVHLSTPLAISSTSAMNYINSDNELKQDILAGRFNTNSSSASNKQIAMATSPVIMLVEFKIVPVSSISATIRNAVDVIDPYVTSGDIN